MRDYIRRKISAAYFTDSSGVTAPVDIWDYLGVSLIDTPPTETVPPIVTVNPTLPGSANVGDTISLSLGAASGIPSPTPIWDLRRDGTSIRDSVSQGMTVTVSAGTYALSVIWTNSAGAVNATTATLTVAPSAGAWTDTTAWNDAASWDDALIWSN